MGKFVKNNSTGIFYDGINDPIYPGKSGEIKKPSSMANQCLKFGGLTALTEAEAKAVKAEEEKEAAKKSPAKPTK